MRVGLTLLANSSASPLSPHFGKAKWIAVHDDESGEIRFARNEGLSGRSVAQFLEANGCTHAVFAHIGPGALAHLKTRGIQTYYGPLDVPASTLLERLATGSLELAEHTESHDHHCSH